METTWTHAEMLEATKRWTQHTSNLTRDLMRGCIASVDLYARRDRYGNNPRARVSDIRQRIRPRGWDIVVTADRRRGVSVYSLERVAPTAQPSPTPPTETASQDDLFPQHSTAW